MQLRYGIGFQKGFQLQCIYVSDLKTQKNPVYNLKRVLNIFAMIEAFHFLLTAFVKCSLKTTI